MTELVKVRPLDEQGHVVGVALARPAGPNALSMELCRQLQSAIAPLAGGRTRAVVLYSEEPHFCVGADLKERHSLDADGLVAARSVSNGLTRMLIDLPIPIIGAAHGFALGGGLELLLLCDVLVADRDAVLGLPESRVGIVPGGGGTQLLARRVGWGRASLLTLTGRRIGADDAVDWGLVDLVAEPGEALAVAEGIAREIAEGSPRSASLIKQAMRDGYGAGVHEALDVEDAAWRLAALSSDYQTGLSAFVAKRRPDWPDRTASTD